MRVFHLLLAVELLAAASLAGCGGTTNTDTGTLAGEWDGVGTRLGRSQVQVHLTLQPGQFTLVTSESDEITATASGDDFSITYHRNTGSMSSFYAVRTPAALDTGALPVAIGGGWTAISGLTGCTASLSATTVDGMCSPLRRIPGWLQIFADGQAHGTRTSSLQSIFGQLGGTWSINTAHGDHCDVTVEGSSASATCVSPYSQLPKTVHIDFNGATASGGTSSGIEFSAHRL